MENSVKRLLEFVDVHGGISSVSEKIGVSKVLFYNYKNRGSMPNMGVLELLSNHYEDFDSEMVLRGTSRVNVLSEKVKNFEEQQNKWVARMMEKENFNDVYTSNQLVNEMLVDNIDELDGLDVVTRNRFLGQSYYSDLIGEA